MYRVCSFKEREAGIQEVVLTLVLSLFLDSGSGNGPEPLFQAWNDLGLSLKRECRRFLHVMVLC